MKDAVYEAKFGKEDAKKLVKSLELAVEEATTRKWYEVKDELLDKLVTKEVFYTEINALRTELLGKMEKDKAELLGKTEKDKAELNGRIDNINGRIDNIKIELEGKIGKLNMKLNFLLILMLIALTLMNPVMAEILKHLLKL